MNVVYIEGCQRSGNHLLVQWMRKFMRKSCYVDNVCYNIEEHLDNGFCRVKTQTVKEAAEVVKESIEDTSLTDLIVSTEHPGLLTYDEIDIVIGSSNPRFTNITKLSLLRDPLNWMSSYAKLRAGYKIFGNSDKHAAKKSQIYANYANYHGEYWNRWYRSYLRWKETPLQYRVNYNTFISDENYRKKLAESLALIWKKKRDEKGLGEEAIHGSSFKKNDLSSTYIKRFDYMIPMFMALPLPYHIIKATQDDFPEVYKAYEQAMLAADL